MPSANDARLANILGAFATAVTDRMVAAFAADGRGDRAAAALTLIAEEPGVAIETLRRYLALSHSACVRLVDQLEADGLAARSVAPQGDRRIRALRLTGKGEAAAKTLRASRAGVVGRAVARLTVSERRDLAALIERMMPAVIADGDDVDVVCRHCDQDACPDAACPAERCRREQGPA